MKKETRTIHKGTYKDKFTGGVNTPIFTSSANNYVDNDNTPYPRYFNTVNQATLGKKIADLEGSEAGLVFSSGMGAISTSILAFAGNGDNVVMLDALYGGTHSFATSWFEHFGISCTFTKTDADDVINAVKDNTKVIVVESPTNPLLDIVDIEKIARFAKQNNVITIIDNTFASPINQNPIEMGIDIVVHSGTKYLGGHSDICCGLIACSNKKLITIVDLARLLGPSLDPRVCYLLERSMKTLSLRVGKQTENAGEVSRFLENHSKVNKVYYPGLESSRGHEIAKKQMSGFGAMLSFELVQEDSYQFVNRLKLIQPAVSLGGLETTICPPSLTSHAKMSKRERERIGVKDSLLRLSVGAEHPEDIIADIDQALS